MAGDYDEAGYFDRCACCGAPLIQPDGEGLNGSYGDQCIPSRDQGYEIDVYAGFWVYLRIVMRNTPVG